MLYGQPFNKASQNRQQAGWTRFTRLCWQALNSKRKNFYMGIRILFLILLYVFFNPTVSAESTKRVLDFISELEVLVKEGNLVAEFHLGNIYMEGLEGVSKDQHKGYGYLLSSAKGGHIQAQYNLAASYKLGQGIPQNTEKALHWYLQAANNGHANAQLQSALILQNRKKYSEAIVLFNKAALQGIVDAQFLLASVYHFGKGAPQNYRIAYVWYSIAAANGDSDSEKMRDMVLKQLDNETIAKAQNEAAKIFESMKSNG